MGANYNRDSVIYLVDERDHWNRGDTPEWARADEVLWGDASL
jgi:hypothetical protein